MREFHHDPPAHYWMRVLITAPDWVATCRCGQSWSGISPVLDALSRHGKP